MQITPEISGKIKLLRLPLIIGIVTIHSSINPVGYADNFSRLLFRALGAVPAWLFCLFFQDFCFSEILTYR